MSVTRVNLASWTSWNLMPMMMIKMLSWAVQAATPVYLKLGRREQQTCISPSSRGWKSELSVPARLGSHQFFLGACTDINFSSCFYKGIHPIAVSPAFTRQGHFETCISSKKQVAETIWCLPKLFYRNLKSAESSWNWAGWDWIGPPTLQLGMRECLLSDLVTSGDQSSTHRWRLVPPILMCSGM